MGRRPPDASSDTGTTASRSKGRTAVSSSPDSPIGISAGTTETNTTREPIYSYPPSMVEPPAAVNHQSRRRLEKIYNNPLAANTPSMSIGEPLPTKAEKPTTSCPRRVPATPATQGTRGWSRRKATLGITTGPADQPKRTLSNPVTRTKAA